ncbi:unnamed protein product [Calypogeia fissa]
MSAARAEILRIVQCLVILWFAFVSPARGWVGNGYNVVSVNDLSDGSGIQAVLTPVTAGDVYGSDISFLAVTARYEMDTRVHVHITDANSTRWEVPQSLIPRLTDWDPLPHFSKPKLKFTYTTRPFGFAITRVSTGEVLFNSTPGPESTFGPMVFKDLYLEISTMLPADSALFGLGESTRPDGLRLAAGRTYTLWNMDIAATNINVNLYGAFPYYVDVRDGGSTHSVLLLNSNGMDVSYNGTFLTFKPIGGVLDFYFFAGPTPAEVADQYTLLVGRPAPMPYWTLGFHQCRWGYKDVTELAGVVANYSLAKIPLETIWSDIDHMDSYKDFTLDPINYPPAEMAAFLEKLHANGQHYVLIVDPGIHLDSNYSSYVRGMAADIFIKNPNGEPFLGQVWPGAVHFPDFLHPKIQDYWTTEVTEFHKIAAFDGLWIDMNEVSNFCQGTSCTVAERPPGVSLTILTTCFLNCSSTFPSGSIYDNPPYSINAADGHVNLGTKTIEIDARHDGGEIEYNTHNMYGFTEAISTNKALISALNKRPFVLARSTFVGSGKYTAHWTGDNGATWDDIAYSVVSILNSGMFGIPMVGADICGFQFNTTEELCARWIELGAFYPFARNHANINTINHELYLWESVTKISRNVLGMRYRLLPFLYTLVYEAHTTGAPIARPLFFEYPQDPTTLGVNSQYLLGKSLLISPVLYQGNTTVKAYFPAGTWYNLFDFSQMLDVSGQYLVLDAPFDVMNVHIAAGSIIPMQDSALTTAQVRKTPFTLIVAFSTSDDSKAAGELFLDDGEEIDMKLEAGSSSLVDINACKEGEHGWVMSQVTCGEYAQKQGWQVQTIVILGLSSAPSSLAINGDPAPSSVSIMQYPMSKVVEISRLNLPLGQDFSLSW